MYKNKTGVLLLNTGSPSAPTALSVWRYLREFLNDPRVIDLPTVSRKLLLYGIILPYKLKKVAKAYQVIWDQQLGAPLLFHSRNLTLAVQAALGSDYVVRLGMRYGKPSIEVAIQPLLLSYCDKIIVVPLFPHYASASTGSVISKALSVLGRQINIPAIEVIRPFYQHSAYMEALATSMFDKLQVFSPEHLLLSYHGLPVRQIKNSEPKMQQCDYHAPCPSIRHENYFCYRAQCYTTSSLLSQKLNISKNKITTVFQSKMGGGRWISPELEEMLMKLRKNNVKKLAIATPSFVVDCLETLEEIGIRTRKSWLQMGGEEFLMLPCLNEQPDWVQALSHIIKG